MPSPPITIGELVDVPAYDSPIASPWAQETTRRIVHRFASTAERDAKYPAAGAGVGAMCEVAATLYISDGTRWVGGHYGMSAPYNTGVPVGTLSWWQITGWVPTTADGFSFDPSGNIIQTIPLGGTFTFSWYIGFAGLLTAPSAGRVLFTPAGGGVLSAYSVGPANNYYATCSGVIRIPPGGGTFQTQLYLFQSASPSPQSGFLELHRTGP